MAAVLCDNYGFFDYADGDGTITEYNSSEFADFLKLFGNGIAYGIGYNLACTSTGLVVTMQTGTVMIQGRAGMVTSDKTLNISAATSGYTRIDLIIARMNVTDRTVEVEVLQGTESAGTPVAPTLTTTATTYEIALYRVKITGGSTTLILSDIRPYVVPFQQISVPSITTAAITLYVNAATGSDTTGDGSSSAPYATIQKAINQIPPIINHTVTINVADGTYVGFTAQGYSGYGSISIIGNTTTPANCIISSAVSLKYFSMPIIFSGFSSSLTAGENLAITDCADFTINYFRVVRSTAAGTGIAVRRSKGEIANCTLTYNNFAIWAYMSDVYSNTNSGSSNNYGLGAYKHSGIQKTSTQPAGTTAETYDATSVIG